MYVELQAVVRARGTDILQGRLVTQDEHFSVRITHDSFLDALHGAEAMGEIITIRAVREVREPWEC
jgi:hypothetical protein